MDTQTAIKQLIAQQHNPDTEAAHSNADRILCDLLIALGHQSVVNEYKKVEKWFA